MRRLLPSSIALSLALFTRVALAQTGICDSTPEAPQACIDAIQNSGGVINDIFRDANGLTGPQLPVFGKFVNAWPACDSVSFAGCQGQSNAPYDCPGQYGCTGLPNTFANAENQLNQLDRFWGHPCRLTTHDLDPQGCPQWTACVADGDPTGYNPWEGLVFDLGGPSNKVAIFASNDHGPQPCESVEYTVFLSDNPFAKEANLFPATDGVDPQKWNRAVLSKIYTKGWAEVRPPDPAGHAACGDTGLYSVEDDSFVSVYSLPCGITFRYTAIVAGNDGLDFLPCQFHSSEAELDAVAGLTDSGSAVCPDNDKDTFVDCNCLGAPPVCDCNDQDEFVYPGAKEFCDSVDMNCDGQIGTCANNTLCYQGSCYSPCDPVSGACTGADECTTTTAGQLCLPPPCQAGSCPDGTVCTDGVCVPACQDVQCPGGQSCVAGACINLCASTVCPAGTFCQEGKCSPPCSCYAGDIGCQQIPGTVCDSAAGGLCVPPLCEGALCDASQTCDPSTGQCVDFCNPSVVCPQWQICKDQVGCVPLCQDVMCDQGFICNPTTGVCDDHRCDNVTCTPPQVCDAGNCVGGTGGSGGSSTGGSAGSGGSSGMGGSANAGTAGSSGGNSGNAGNSGNSGSSGSSGSSGGSAGSGASSNQGGAGGSDTNSFGTTPNNAGDDGGCGCKVPAQSDRQNGTPSGLLMLAIASGIAMLRRKRLFIA